MPVLGWNVVADAGALGGAQTSSLEFQKRQNGSPPASNAKGQWLLLLVCVRLDRLYAAGQQPLSREPGLSGFRPQEPVEQRMVALTFHCLSKRIGQEPASRLRSRESPSRPRANDVDGADSSGRMNGFRLSRDGCGMDVLNSRSMLLAMSARFR